ncbi:hypothetical protein TVAG_380690 [Trichomonas vaginalis G3]|uniref:Uncharacterized protein n=1 Tax=Trichomonas vaginalis (strain ATCC PRA-98 / G3) TaxID=412133 RepID=A2FWE6_TRIV3|nr:hypothetical protein TVAGG3_0327840 [Trichomonas vaginalis G3]EAX90773.1 hypothetical protein TVAG_380690 [Trichomonas vaginalis G3]KAI5529750.1 hypothetical protein TVAGG3_0327840 [Trichomonas vaginalis G3]|eukprot:XP_001303703.1 hypothetical protein [Trichomonas vaginalis G3]
MDFDKLCAKYADLIEIEEMIFDIGECDIAKLFNKVKTAMKKYNIHPNYYQKMIDHASINYPQYLYQYWTLFQLIRYEFDYLISCINLESDLKKAYYREYGLIKKYQSDELPIPSFSECFSHYPKSGIIHSIMEDKSKTIKKFIEKNAAEEED